MARRFLPVATVLLALLALPATGLSQVTKTKDGFLLRIKWEKGDSYKLLFLTSTEMSPGNSFKFSIESSLNVLDVKDEIATVAMSLTNPLTNEPMEVTVKMNDRGIADDELAASMNSGNSQVILPFPEKALKVGDSWEVERIAAVQSKEMKVKTTYTFEGLKIVDKVPCSVISLKISGETLEDKNKLSMFGTGVMYLENTSCQIFKGTIKTTIQITPGENGIKLPSVTEIKRK